MTKLLISVRSADEARIATSGGADIIDVKEPNRGSLGKADVRVWREVVRQVSDVVPVSVALGELRHEAPPKPASLNGIQFAKIGLAECATFANWHKHWQYYLEQLPTDIASVAVSYVDRAAKAPHPREILERGVELNCQLFLLDTFTKTNGGLFDHMSVDQVCELSELAHRAGLQIAIAGSLDADSLPLALQVGPEIIAVRGAVCTGNRQGSLSLQRIQRLQSLLANVHS